MFPILQNTKADILPEPYRADPPLSRHLQPLLTPNAGNALMIDLPSRLSQHRRHHAVPIGAIGVCLSNHCLPQRILVRPSASYIAIRASGNLKN